MVVVVSNFQFSNNATFVTCVMVNLFRKKSYCQTFLVRRNIVTAGTKTLRGPQPMVYKPIFLRALQSLWGGKG